MLIRLIVGEKPKLGEVIDRLGELKPGAYTIEVKKQREKVSQPQRGYYHGVVVRTLALAIGDTDEAIHDLLKEKFNPREIVLKTGEIVKIGGSTTKFDTKEMTVYIEKIRNWAHTEQGIYIPEPNEVTFDMMAEFSKQYDSMMF